MDRRSLLGLAVAAVAQTTTPVISPIPTSRDWTNQQPIQYPDPDIVALDPRFRK